MSHAFVVTDATRRVIYGLFSKLVRRVLRKQVLERRAQVVFSLLYPTDSREYFIYSEVIRCGFVPEAELLQRPIQEAMAHVNPFVCSKFHCSTVGHVTVAGVREAKCTNSMSRVMIISVWTPDDASVQIAKRLSLCAPTLWEAVLVRVQRDLGIS